jgi:hypothetical protein
MRQSQLQTLCFFRLQWHEHFWPFIYNTIATLPYCVILNTMDLFHNEQNFDLDKSRQTFRHHGLKEHNEISNIPKFRCEML